VLLYFILRVEVVEIQFWLQFIKDLKNRKKKVFLFSILAMGRFLKSSPSQPSRPVFFPAHAAQLLAQLSPGMRPSWPSCPTLFPWRSRRCCSPVPSVAPCPPQVKAKLGSHAVLRQRDSLIFSPFPAPSKPKATIVFFNSCSSRSSLRIRTKTWFKPRLDIE
jgi:hypothetical protein